jgi:pantoate kinase
LKACAFAPGHVTGFFEIHDEAEDLSRRGSRGVGICLSKGVFTEVKIQNSDERNIEISLVQGNAPAPVTRGVVERIIGNMPLQVEVSSTLELPQGQGFGMSGAGALSTALALVKALNLDISMNELVCIAHETEISLSTGLGDVMPQSIGGVVIRHKEGCYPQGKLEKIDAEDVEIVLCVIGEELPTKEIITDPDHKRRINENGKRCLHELLETPDLESMMRLSCEFSKDIGLETKEVEDAISAAKGFGMVSMSMLGNSVFAFGKGEQLAGILEKFGEVYICGIDQKGARIVEEA